MTKKKAIGILTALALCLPVLVVDAIEQGGKGEAEKQRSYQLETAVMGSAGCDGESASFGTKGTLGQPTPIGTGDNGTQWLSAGFWAMFAMLSDVTSVQPSEIPQNSLQMSYPNPFNPATTIEYAVAVRGMVNLEIFNLKGQRVRTLIQEHQPPGRYQVVWKGRDNSGQIVSSGPYFYRLTTGDYQSVKKMLLIK